MTVFIAFFLHGNRLSKCNTVLKQQEVSSPPDHLTVNTQELKQQQVTS